MTFKVATADTFTHPIVAKVDMGQFYSFGPQKNQKGNVEITVSRARR